MSAAGPSQGANHAPSGGVGAHASAAGPFQGANRAPSGGVGAPASAAGPGNVERVAAGDVAAVLRERLARLAPAHLELRDDSALHAGHAGAAAGGGHYSLTIVSNFFSGLPRLARHRRVMREVADLVPLPIHALSIKALTPEEFQSQP